MGIISRMLREAREAQEALKAAEEARAFQEAESARELKVLQGLQEIFLAIDRLNPEWEVEGQTISFSKDTENGTYKGSVSYQDSYEAGNGGWDSDDQWPSFPGSSSVSITLSNGAEVINVFSRGYSRPYLKNYILNHPAHREQIARQELERARIEKAAEEVEQKKKEAEKKAQNRFLGRKTKKAPVLVTALPAVLPINAKASSDFTVNDATDLCTSGKASADMKRLLERRKGKGNPLTDAEFIRKTQALAKYLN